MYFVHNWTGASGSSHLPMQLRKGEKLNTLMAAWGPVICFCGPHQAAGRLTLSSAKVAEILNVSLNKLWRETVLQIGMKRNTYMLLGSWSCFVCLPAKQTMTSYRQNFLGKIIWGLKFQVIRAKRLLYQITNYHLGFDSLWFWINNQYHLHTWIYFQILDMAMF